MKNSNMPQIESKSSWGANHWLLFVNLFFLLYFGLPLMAPILKASGYELFAYPIYKVYSFLCHQIPSHAYFIMGEQVALCQRCLAIYISLFIGGLMFSFDIVRSHLPPLPLKWYLLCLIPMAVDGGMQFVTELTIVIPILILWVIGLTLMAVLSFLLYYQHHLHWQVIIFFLAGPLSLIVVQLTEGYESTWWIRTLTALIFAMGTICMAYPILEQDFRGRFQAK